MVIDILLATYNGEKYLREQLDSIVQQNNRDWRIIARDDGSNDGTAAVLSEYRKKIGAEKFIILPASDRSESIHKEKRVIRNFSALMEWSKKDSKADYIMFCDQDDVWFPDKIEKTLRRMQRIEGQYGKQMPLLVNTDVAVADADGSIQKSSLKKVRRLNTQKRTFRNELVQCAVQGCTSMMNRSLLEISTPVPDEARMHDMWVALVASSVGKHGFIDEPTMAYRQHGSNVFGASPHNLSDVVHRFQCALDDFTSQAGALHERVGDRMSPALKGDLERFLEISQQPQPLRGVHFAAEGYRRTGSWVRNVALFGGTHRDGRNANEQNER